MYIFQLHEHIWWWLIRSMISCWDIHVWKRLCRLDVVTTSAPRTATLRPMTARTTTRVPEGNSCRRPTLWSALPSCPRSDMDRNRWTVIYIRRKSFTTACFYFLILSQVRLWSGGVMKVGMDTEWLIIMWICETFFPQKCLTGRYTYLCMYVGRFG